MRNIIPVSYQISSLAFCRSPPTKIANLSEQELNQLVEQRNSALEDGTKKKQQTGVYQPIEVSKA